MKKENNGLTYRYEYNFCALSEIAQLSNKFSLDPGMKKIILMFLCGFYHYHYYSILYIATYFLIIIIIIIIQFCIYRRTFLPT